MRNTKRGYSLVQNLEQKSAQKLGRKLRIIIQHSLVFILMLMFAPLGHSQNVGSSEATDVLDETTLHSTPIAKIYMARVLLENHENWAEAYELLRDVLKNHREEMNSIVYKKIDRAAKQVARYLPETYIRQKVNARHLIRPFLEAQYLLNEALMDWRVALNNSSDSETVFVEKLLQSYFFPGFEDRGMIMYPDQTSYAFDIFALTPENVQRARRHTSTDKDPRQGGYNNRYPTSPSTGIPGGSGGGSPYIPRPPGVPGTNPTPVPPFVPPGGGSSGGTVGGGTPVSPWPRPPGSGVGRGPVDWDNPAFNMKLYKANGFIDDALQSGVDLGDITEEVVRIIKQFKIDDRVTNRYLEQALMMQSIADPGSILFDPQLQEFLKGVRLTVYLGDMPANSANEWDLLKDVLSEKLVTRDKEGNVRIKMSGLVGEQRPGTQEGLEIRLQQVQGGERQALYVISGIAGPDLLRLRLFMSMATIFRDWDKGTAMARTAAGVISQTQTYIYLAKMGKLVIDFSKIGARDAGRVLMWMIRIVYYTIEAFPGIKPQSINQIRELLRTAALTISRGGVEKFTKFYQWMNPRVQQTFNYVKNQKYIKNGAAANGLLVLALAAETFIIATQYKHAKNADEKYEVWQEGASRLGATLTYALPVVGMGAAIVDLAHNYLKLPFETADAFRAYRRGVENWAYKHYSGMNKMEFDLFDLQMSLNLPRNPFYIERYAKQVTTLEQARQNMVELDQQIQDISSRYLILLYVAHNRIAPTRQNIFGRKQEVYMTEFAGNYNSYTRTRALLLESMVRLKDDKTPPKDDLFPIPGDPNSKEAAKAPPVQNQTPTNGAPTIGPFLPPAPQVPTPSPVIPPATVKVSPTNPSNSAPVVVIPFVPVQPGSKAAVKVAEPAATVKATPATRDLPRSKIPTPPPAKAKSKVKAAPAVVKKVPVTKPPVSTTLPPLKAGNSPNPNSNTNSGSTPIPPFSPPASNPGTGNGEVNLPGKGPTSQMRLASEFLLSA